MPSTKEKLPTLRKINGVYYRRLADTETPINHSDLVQDYDGGPSRPIYLSYRRPVSKCHPESVAGLYGVWRKLPVPAGYRVLDLDEVLGARKLHWATINPDGSITDSLSGSWVAWDITAVSSYAEITLRQYLKDTAASWKRFRDVVFFAPLPSAPLMAPTASVPARAMPKAPAGWRILGADEKTKEGDYYLDYDGTFEFDVRSEQGYSKNNPRNAWLPNWAAVIRPVKIAQGHNPDNLTEEQVGTSEGYRLLTRDEIRDAARLDRSDVECWSGSAWVNKGVCSVVGCFANTYRTAKVSLVKAPQIASGHNPHKLTEEQVEVSKGYRLLTAEEIAGPQRADVEYWTPDRQAWNTVVSASRGHCSVDTYRTKQPVGSYTPKPVKTELELAKEEIARLKAQASGNAVLVRRDGFQKPIELLRNTEHVLFARPPVPGEVFGVADSFRLTSEKDAFGRTLYREGV